MILANVLNIELEIPKSEQGPGMGGAMLSMVACGEYESVAAAYQSLAGDDGRQSGLTQTGRAVEQGVIQGFISAAGGFNINGQVALCLLLPYILRKSLRTEADLAIVLGDEGGAGQFFIKAYILGKINTHMYDLSFLFQRLFYWTLSVI